MGIEGVHEYIFHAKCFHKSIHMLVFYKYIFKYKKSEFCFEDRVVVLNDLFYRYIYVGST
jgi:hypothetical protein